MKVTDYIVDFFEQRDYRDVFLINGGGCMHIANSFGDSSLIKYWCMHHEQALSMAAEAYSKISEKPAIVVATSGAGAANTITGILDCYLDSIPVFFIFGQSKKTQTVINSGVNKLRQFGVAEAPIVSMVSPITKYAVEINDPKSIRYHLERAVYEATSGRPGPVVLSIPLDVQSSNINEYELNSFSDEKKRIADEIQNSDLEYTINALKKSERPVIICGHGVRLSHSITELKKFALKNNIPVVVTFMAIDALEEECICNIGRIGTKGTRAGNFALQNADLVISIGSRLSVNTIGFEYELFAREAKVIIVDIDAEEHKKKTIDIDRIIISDAGAFIREIDKKVNNGDRYKKWLHRCIEWKHRYPVVLPEYSNDANGINYYKMVDLIGKVSPGDSVFISDAGSSFFVVAQSLKIREEQRHVTTGGTATMGFAIPAAYGIAVYDQTRTVVAITGEGSFMQNMQELEAIKYHSFNIKLFVMCNDGYFSIRNHQKRFFKSHYVGSDTSSGISFTDLKKLSEAFGLSYLRITKLNECDAALSKIFSSEDPMIIQVDIDPDMKIMPVNTYMVKPNGVLVSKPLEDMYPFLDRDEFRRNMIVEPVND